MIHGRRGRAGAIIAPDSRARSDAGNCKRWTRNDPEKRVQDD